MDTEAQHIIGLYERNARNYDRDRSRQLMEQAWLDRFLALLPARSSILDMGCGLGEPIARYLVSRGHSVTGLDSSPAMIEICRARYPAQEWIVSDMRVLALGRQFDGLLAWDSLFHLTPDDQRRMFAIFGAHAVARAALMFTSGPSHGVAIGAYQGEPLYHASLDPQEYRTLLAGIGFAVVENVSEDTSCGNHTIWLAQRA
jgi:SAM-dependent methyltransferase